MTMCSCEKINHDLLETHVDELGVLGLHKSTPLVRRDVGHCSVVHNKQPGFFHPGILRLVCASLKEIHIVFNFLTQWNTALNGKSVNRFSRFVLLLV
jgi:hypothetical protein